MSIIGALVTGGGVVIAGGIAWARRHLSDQGTVVRLLGRAPRTPINELLDLTRAKVVGTCRVDADPLVLPLTTLPCVAYELEVWQRPGKRVVDPFIRAHSSAHAVAFLIEDETGTARCAGRFEGVALQKVRLPAIEARKSELLESLALPTDIETRVRVGALFEGERVAVHGLVTIEASADAGAAGFRGAMQRPVIGPNRSTGMLLSNLPRALR